MYSRIRNRRHPAGALVLGAVAIAAVAGVLALSDDVEATHFWSGMLTNTYIDGDNGQVPAFTGYLSYDTTYIPGMSCTDPVKGLVLGYNPALWGYISVNGVETDYNLNIIESDEEHCRFIGEIALPSTELPVEDVSRTMSQPIPYASTSDPTYINFFLCCRENHPSHRNNKNLQTQIELVVTGTNNYAPQIPFEIFAPGNGIMSEKGYGNIHCPQDSICNIQIPALDPEEDKLTFRLASAQEATGSGTFNHPGPNCPGCKTGPYSVDKDSGIITWDTSGASQGNYFSSQVIVSDGRNRVPIDFQIEVGPPPPPCWDGSTPVVNPYNGEVTCPEPPPPPCPPGTFLENPNDPYSQCIWPPPSPYVVLEEDPILRETWYAPPLTPPTDKDPAISGGDPYAYAARDRIDWQIAQFDQDGDGTPDRSDLCPFNDRTTIEDLDGDGLGDACDDDMDGDGQMNKADPCPFDAANSCVAPTDELTASALASKENAAVLRAEGTASRGAAESVAVASVEAPQSATGSYMLVLLGVACAVLLLAMAKRQRK